MFEYETLNQIFNEILVSMEENFKRRHNDIKSEKYHINNKPSRRQEKRSNLILARIDKVIFQDRATVILWKDGTKTVTKCTETEVYDPEKGLAMAILKKVVGNRYYNDMKEIIDIYCPEEIKNKKSSITKKSTNTKTSKTEKSKSEKSKTE